MENKTRVMRRMQHMLEKGLLEETDNSVRETRMLRHAHKKAHSLFQGDKVIYTHGDTQGIVKYPHKVQSGPYFAKLTGTGQAFTRLNGHEYVKACDPQYAIDLEARKEARKEDRKEARKEAPIVQLPKISIDTRIADAQRKLALSEVAPKDHL